MIDTHCHLYVDEFADDLPEVIANAKGAGVRQILLPNIDVGTIRLMHNLESSSPDFFRSMMGLHPGSVKRDFLKQLEIIKENLYSNEYQYVAVGEIGIDLYWDTTYLEEQRKAFQTQIQWAKDLGKPIAIHTRDAFDEVFEVLDAENDESLSGVFHCFTGDADQAKRALSYGGFYLGIGGVVTFKNSGLDHVLESVDLENIVLETDAPYLAPQPHRGRRNEPSYLRLVGEKIATVKGLTLYDVDRVTSENARKLFAL